MESELQLRSLDIGYLYGLERNCQSPRSIEIVIWKENFSDKDFHDGKTIRTTVAEAQKLKCGFPIR